MFRFSLVRELILVYWIGQLYQYHEKCAQFLKLVHKQLALYEYARTNSNREEFGMYVAWRQNPERPPHRHFGLATCSWRVLKYVQRQFNSSWKASILRAWFHLCRLKTGCICCSLQWLRCDQIPHYRWRQRELDGGLTKRGWKKQIA